MRTHSSVRHTLDPSAIETNMNKTLFKSARCKANEIDYKLLSDRQIFWDFWAVP